MNIKDLALVFAIAAVAVASVLLFLGQPNFSRIELPDPDLEVTALPRALDGFAVQEYLERVEPVLPGERYSAVAFFLPEAGRHAGVARLGAMLYFFESPEAVAPGPALGALGNALEPLRLGGHRVHEHRQPNPPCPQRPALGLSRASPDDPADLDFPATAAAEAMVQVIAAQAP